MKSAYVIAVSTPKTTPSSGSSPYAPLPMTPEIRTTPTNTTGIEASERLSGRSPSATQASSPTSTTWMLPRTVASPAPTASIEWCQKREVGGEHHARDPERHALAQRSLAVAPALEPRQQREHGQGVRAAEERGGGRRHLREPHEDRGERDHHRAEHSRRVRACQSRRSRLAGGIVRPVNRDTVLWTVVLFFGASVMFGAIRNATEDEGTGLSLGYSRSPACC